MHTFLWHDNAQYVNWIISIIFIQQTKKIEITQTQTSILRDCKQFCYNSSSSIDFLFVFLFLSVSFCDERISISFILFCLNFFFKKWSAPVQVLHHSQLDRSLIEAKLIFDIHDDDVKIANQFLFELIFDDFLLSIHTLMIILFSSQFFNSSNIVSMEHFHSFYGVVSEVSLSKKWFTACCCSVGRSVVKCCWSFKVDNQQQQQIYHLFFRELRA